jgi:hypothetical protein
MEADVTMTAGSPTLTLKDGDLAFNPSDGNA